MGVLTFGVLAPPERCPRVDEGDLRRGAHETVGWFLRNQRPDGTWLYLYDVGSRTSSRDYDIVRHAGVISSLYQAATAGIPGALESADRGLAWALARTVALDGASAVAGGTPLRTGSTALLAAGLAERRLLTGDRRYDNLLGHFGRFLAGQTEPSGAVLASYDPDTRRAVPGDYSEYFTGEAYWALARLHLLFPDARWGRVSRRIGRYLATRRDDAEDRWPPVPDHWAAYGLAETARFPDRPRSRPLTPAEVRYARRQAGIFAQKVRWVSQRFGPWGRLVRGGFIPRGGGYGVFGEGLTGLWRVTRADARLAPLEAAVGRQALCNASLAVRAQSSGPAPTERGAWFRHGETRMDDQQHALSALLRTIPIAEAAEAADAAGGAPAPSSPGATPPSAWLWLGALVAGVNAPRAALAVPRAGRSRSGAARLAALGGLGAGVTVVVVAASSGPLLDVVDVNPPALRIAAGVVAVAMGLLDLIRRAPAPEPSLPGWRAAIVPVAVPTLARAPLLVLALSAGADRGVALVAAAMAVGVGALTGLAALASPEADTPGERAASRTWLSWAGALLGASLVVAAAALVVDGVLDV